MQKKNLELEKQRTESQIALIDQQITMKDEKCGKLAQIAVITKNQRFANVKVALEGINTQYQSAS